MVIHPLDTIKTRLQVVGQIQSNGCGLNVGVPGRTLGQLPRNVQSKRKLMRTRMYVHSL
jgi:hypothetical protein